MCLFQFVRPAGKELLPHRGWGWGGRTGGGNICFINRPIYDMYLFFESFINDLLFCFLFMKLVENHERTLFLKIVCPPGRELLRCLGWGWGSGGIGTNICSIHHPIYDLYLFVNDSLLLFFFISYEINGKLSNPDVCFYSLASRQRTFATPRMGMGRGGTNRGQYLYHHPIE